MPRFKPLYERALDRKGGTEALTELLPSPRSSEDLQDLAEDRYLAMMTKCINQAGFSWKVIEKKWPEFRRSILYFQGRYLITLIRRAMGSLHSRQTCRS